ncbi:MAG TPA: protein phosphatase 2C domain-containing protein [Gemmataceae bacterium]|nr:protein phosphatase 2C domain-containing protein [Gemmataceae bacterium]
MNPSPLRWRSFLVPKAGHSAEECEDAIDGDPEAGRFAVADGASESYTAGEWARYLVGAYVRPPEGTDWFAAAREGWQQEIGSAALSWYAEDKLARGAHATFLGLSVHASGDQVEWEAIAVGDACLFVLSPGVRPVAFPIARSSDFTSAPVLVSSRGAWPGWRTERGTLRPGETLLLATDALAQFLLKSSDEGEFAGPSLMGLEEDDDFALWVAMTRDQGRLRNDDVALGVVEVGISSC